MDFPEIPIKVKGVWQNCNRGMLALGRSTHFHSANDIPVIFKLVSNMEWMSRTRADRPPLYNKPYDVWVHHGVITNDYAGPIGTVSSAEAKRLIRAYIDKTGIPLLKHLIESDPAATFEYQLGLLEQDLHE